MPLNANGAVALGKYYSEGNVENLPGSFSILAFTVIAEMEHTVLSV